MRQLTQTEIVNKPHWAKSYSIHAQNDTPIFYAGESGGAIPIPPTQNDTPIFYAGEGGGAITIPGEEFDIHSVRLSDDNIDCLGHCDNKKLWTYFKDETYYTSESRADVIAKAKHFKLTADDLR